LLHVASCLQMILAAAVEVKLHVGEHAAVWSPRNSIFTILKPDCNKVYNKVLFKGLSAPLLHLVQLFAEECGCCG
jgi:hypothetical protein